MLGIIEKCFMAQFPKNSENGNNVIYRKNASQAVKAGGNLPSTEQLQKELNRVQYQKRYSFVVRSTVSVLITVAALAILVATLWMPVLRIFGTSMEPTLTEGDLVVTVKKSSFEPGEIISFYYNNKILVKRSIAGPGQWVDIDDEGNVYVDGVLLDEPYLTEKALGECNIELPFQVPDERWFVIGDHRRTSIDSRNSAIGCVAEEQVVGQLVFCVWPLSKFGPIK